MSIFNPWGELRALKARLAAEEEAYRVEEAQQQAYLDDLEKKNFSLRIDNERLSRDLKDLISNNGRRAIELERKLSQTAAETHKLTKQLKSRARMIERRDAEIRELERALTASERKHRDALREFEGLKAVKVKFMSQNLEVIALKQQVEALKDKLAGSVRRDPKTGRLLPKGK